MNTRNAWRWPLRSRGRLIALVLAGLALALITKTILDTATSTAAPAGPGRTGHRIDHDRERRTSRPRSPPTPPNASPYGPRDPTGTPACTGSTATPRRLNRPATGASGSSTPPVVIGIPVTTTIEGGGSGYLPEADQAAALDVAARFVDAWYAGGSDQAWRDQVSRWADPTLAQQLATLNRDVLPGSRRVTEPAMRAFQPGLASTGVATNNGSLALTVIYTDAGWRVVTVTTEAP